MLFRRTFSGPISASGGTSERRQRSQGLAVAGLTVAVLAVTGCGAEDAQPAAKSSPTPSATRSATPTPTPSPTSTVVAGKSCVGAGTTETVRTAAGPTPTPTPSPVVPKTASASASATSTPTPTSSGVSIAFVCTEDDDGALVWMDEDSSKTVLANRQGAADQKAADELAVAQAVEAQRIADENAAAAAAAVEAQRLADEQAAQAYIPPAPVPAAPAPAPVAPEPAPADVYYQNCDAVRAAGAAPIYAGQPGWQPKFDRDGDGVGCE